MGRILLSTVAGLAMLVDRTQMPAAGTICSASRGRGPASANVSRQNASFSPKTDQSPASP